MHRTIYFIYIYIYMRMRVRVWTSRAMCVLIQCIMHVLNVLRRKENSVTVVLQWQDLLLLHSDCMKWTSDDGTDH